MENILITASKNEIPTDSHFFDMGNDMLRELFFVEKPNYKEKEEKDYSDELRGFIEDGENDLVWAYFPWKNEAYRVLSEKLYLRVLLSRNNYLITSQEQEYLWNAHVGIAGLSVGSNILEALVRSGGTSRINIADFDTVELSNLNRMKAGVCDYGEEKIIVAQRALWEINPFITLGIYNKGIDEKNIDDFITNPKLNIFVDAIDNLALKIKVRHTCKAKRIPVIMATDFGDRVVLDVERYDLDGNLDIFNGALQDVEMDKLQSLSKQEWVEIANKIIGVVPDSRLLDSLKKIGAETVTVPQLGSISMIAAALTVKILIRIVSGDTTVSGKYVFDTNELIS